MKRLLVVAALVVGLAMPALGQDFAAGVDAYKRGDYSTALKEWRPLAERGDPKAQTGLGAMYGNGQGVPQDYVQAYKWFSLAAALGDQIARENRDRAAELMTPAQIAEAQRLAQAWKPKPE